MSHCTLLIILVRPLLPSTCTLRNLDFPYQCCVSSPHPFGRTIPANSQLVSSGFCNPPMAEPTAGISGARAQVERPPPPKPRVKRQGVPTNRPAQRSSAYRLKSIIQRAVMPGIFIDRFNYSPIAKGEIRLLTILKGNQDADMNCTISKWKLSDVKERL